MVLQSSRWVVGTLFAGLVGLWLIPKDLAEWVVAHQPYELVGDVLLRIDQPASGFWIGAFGALALTLLGPVSDPTPGQRLLLYASPMVVLVGLAVWIELARKNPPATRTEVLGSFQTWLVFTAMLWPLLLELVLKLIGALLGRTESENYRWAKWKASGDYRRTSSRYVCLCENDPDPEHHKCPATYYVPTRLIEEASKRPLLPKLFGWGMPRDDRPRRRASAPEDAGFDTFDPSKEATGV